MNIRDLRYLVAVDELQSFSRAAERCFVSQPTLSGQVRKLEEELGVAIFERSNKRVITTDVGRALIDAAARALREVAVMEDIAALAQDPLAGKFRLGAFPTLASYLFPELVPAIKQSLPKLKLILVEEKTQQLVERLKNGELDAAFMAMPIHEDQLEHIEVFGDDFFLAVGVDHPMAKLRCVDRDALHSEKLLLLEEGHCLRDQALDFCHGHGVDEDQEYRATSLETLRQMVRAGSGITLMPEIAITTRDDDDICYIPFDAPAPRRTIGLFYRKSTNRETAIREIAELCKAQHAG